MADSFIPAARKYLTLSDNLKAALKAAAEATDEVSRLNRALESAAEELQKFVGTSTGRRAAMVTDNRVLVVEYSKGITILPVEIQETCR